MSRELQQETQPPFAGRCIRCLEADTSDPLGVCATCSVQLRIELATGLRRFADYLAKWAAFDEWCRGHGAGPAGA